MQLVAYFYCNNSLCFVQSADELLDRQTEWYNYYLKFLLILIETSVTLVSNSNQRSQIEIKVPN